MIENQFLAFFIIAFIATLISIGLAIYAWGLRPAKGAATFSILMVAISIWTGAVGIGMIARSESLALLWAVVRMVGVFATPVLWLILSLQYTGNEGWIKPSRLFLLCIIPLMSLILMVTNDLHHLFLEGIIFESHGPYLIDTRWQMGPWFPVHIAYSYSLILVGGLFFLREALQLPYKASSQAISLFLGATIPLVVNVAYIFHVIPGIIVNYDPLGFVLAGSILAWGLYHYRLFDIMPIARRFLIDSMEDGLLVIDSQDRIVDINPAAQKIFKTSPSLAIGQLVSDVIPKDNFDTYQKNPENEREELKINNATYELQISPLSMSKKDVGNLVLLHDITSQIDLERKLLQLAQQDSLTELPNRRYFFQLAEKEIARAKRYGRDLALIIIDCDHFKFINDNHGHLTGDAALYNLADLLKQQLRSTDILARYGGEEFIIISPESDSESAPLLAERLRSAVEGTPLELEGYQIRLTVSIGVAVLSNDQNATLEDLIKYADQALYKSKFEGRNKITVWET